MRTRLKTTWAQPNTSAYAWFLPHTAPVTRLLFPTRQTTAAQLPSLAEVSAVGENRRFWRAEAVVGRSLLWAAPAAAAALGALYWGAALASKLWALPLYLSLSTLGACHPSLHVLGAAAVLGLLSRSRGVVGAVLLGLLGASSLRVSRPSHPGLAPSRAPAPRPRGGATPAPAPCLYPAYAALAALAGADAHTMPAQSPHSGLCSEPHAAAPQLTSNLAWAATWARSAFSLGGVYGQSRQLLSLQAQTRATLSRGLAAAATRQTELGRHSWAATPAVTRGWGLGSPARGAYLLAPTPQGALPATPRAGADYTGHAPSSSSATAAARTTLGLVQPALAWVATELEPSSAD